MDVSQAAGNLAPGEEIPKGHTHLLAVEGKVYMASQGFHDLKGSIALPSYRGSHLYAYSLSTGMLVLEDRLNVVRRLRAECSLHPRSHKQQAHLRGRTAYVIPHAATHASDSQIIGPGQVRTQSKE
jgi:hypothetical protein